MNKSLLVIIFMNNLNNKIKKKKYLKINTINNFKIFNY